MSSVVVYGTREYFSNFSGLHETRLHRAEPNQTQVDGCGTGRLVELKMLNRIRRTGCRLDELRTELMAVNRRRVKWKVVFYSNSSFSEIDKQKNIGMCMSFKGIKKLKIEYQLNSLKVKKCLAANREIEIGPNRNINNVNPKRISRTNFHARIPKFSPNGISS